jgi:hypothetical protein
MNMKKIYMKPSTEVIIIQQTCSILVGSPDVYDQEGEKEVEFARSFGGWADDEDDDYDY